MTLLENLSDVEVRQFRYYLTELVVASLRSGNYVPDVVFRIIGRLHVDFMSHCNDFANVIDESSKESVSD